MRRTVFSRMVALAAVGLSAELALAQNSAPVVSNVTASQRGDDSKLIDITFNLADADGDACTVWIGVSDNGGASWKVPVQTLSGHFGGGITPGSGKSIVWDAGSDMPGKTGTFRVRVWADDGKGPSAMVLVSGGFFGYQDNPNPEQWVYVDAFLIDKYEVTNQQYCEFLNNADPAGDHWASGMEITRHGSAGAYYYSVASGKENYPIRYVNFYDAEAYAAWRSSQEGVTYRLPSAYEWEKAAAWDPDTEYYYTYGFHRDSIDCSWCNYNNCIGGPMPVGSYNGTGGRNNAKSYYGCYDMSGNVWEWTSEIDGSNRVLRGGHWVNDATVCQCAYRHTESPSDRGSNHGFRLVLDAD